MVKNQGNMPFVDDSGKIWFDIGILLGRGRWR